MMMMSTPLALSLHLPQRHSRFVQCSTRLAHGSHKPPLTKILKTTGWLWSEAYVLQNKRGYVEEGGSDEQWAQSKLTPFSSGGGWKGMHDAEKNLGFTRASTNADANASSRICTFRVDVDMIFPRFLERRRARATSRSS